MSKVPQWFRSNTFKMWRPNDALRRLEAPSWLTRATRCANDVAVRIGRRLVPVGNKVVEMILEFYERFPNTTYATLFFFALTWFVARLPYVGTILAPFFAVVGLFVIGLAFALELLASIGTRHQSRRKDRQ